MGVVYLIYLYAVAVGIVAAGITGSMWALATGERPRFGLLFEPSSIAPVRALVVVAAAPLMIFLSGFAKVVSSPVLGILLIVASLGWSFLQGVFILTQFFGVT